MFEVQIYLGYFINYFLHIFLIRLKKLGILLNSVIFVVKYCLRKNLWKNQNLIIKTKYSIIIILIIFLFMKNSKKKYFCSKYYLFKNSIMKDIFKFSTCNSILAKLDPHKKTFVVEKSYFIITHGNLRKMLFYAFVKFEKILKSNS